MEQKLDAWPITSETPDSAMAEEPESVIGSLLTSLETGPDLQETDTYFKLYRKRDGVIEVEGTFGYERQTSYEPGDTVIEPDTFYIDWVNVTPNKGLGTMALTWALQVAQDRDFRVCRTDPVSERMVGLIEKLARAGLIKERYYLKEGGPELKPAPPTAEFKSHPATISGDEAIAFLQTKQAQYEVVLASGGDPETIFSAVNCVFLYLAADAKKTLARLTLQPEPPRMHLTC